jgi:hypothetical protein
LKQRELAVRSSGIELAACVVKTRYQSETNSDFYPETCLLSASPKKELNLQARLRKKRAFFVVRVWFGCVVPGEFRLPPAN